MENVFYNFLNPKGSSYASKMATIRQLKAMAKEELIEYLEENFTGKQIKSLLAEYMLAELTHEKPEQTPRIRITQEQFDQYFRVIKPQQNPAKDKGEE